MTRAGARLTLTLSFCASSTLLAACSSGGSGPNRSHPATSPATAPTPTPAPPIAGAPTFPGLGSGTTYVVDGATGDDQNAGTALAPWRTVDRVESANLAPGDQVIVRAGQYELDVNLRLEGLRGTASAWIGLVADGPVRLRNSAAQNVVSIRDCSHLLLRGFEITHDDGAAPYGSWAQVDGVKLEGAPSEQVAIVSCRIHHVGNVGVGSQSAEVRGLLLQGTEIHDCYTAVYWGYYEDPARRYVHDSRIAGCYLHDCPPVDRDGTGYGIQLKGGSRGNVIEDCVLADVGGATRAAIAVYHVSTDAGPRSERNVIRRNLVVRSRGEGIFAVEGALIENNVLVDGRTGIVLARRDTGSWGAFYGNLTVRHNSVLRVTDGAGRGLAVGDGAFTGAFEVGNNLLMVMQAGQLALRGPTAWPGTGRQNLVLGGSQGDARLGAIALTGPGVVVSTTLGAPGFLVPTTGDQADGAADASLASADDFHGVARGAAGDVGAIEAPARGVIAIGFKP